MVGEIDQAIRRVRDWIEPHRDDVESGAEITYTVLNFAELLGEIAR